MSHIPASYDHFWRFSIIVKFGHFSRFSQKSHFGWFTNSWEVSGKIRQTREIIFSRHCFSGNVHLVPKTGEFWVLSRKLCQNWFFNILKFRLSIFSEFLKNHGFQPTTMTFSLKIGCKYVFLIKLFSKLFLFIKNQAIGIFTFTTSSFNQKLWIKTYIQFLDFHDFLHKFLKISFVILS